MQYHKKSPSVQITLKTSNNIANISFSSTNNPKGAKNCWRRSNEHSLRMGGWERRQEAVLDIRILAQFTRQKLTVENTRFGNVPDGCGLYDVPNDELLNSLILGHATGTVGTANRLHVAAALFGTTIVPSFLGLHENENPIRKKAQFTQLIPLPATFRAGNPQKSATQISSPSANPSKPGTNIRSFHSSTVTQIFKSPQSQNLLLSSLHPAPHIHHELELTILEAKRRKRIRPSLRLSYIARDPYAHARRFLLDVYWKHAKNGNPLYSNFLYYSAFPLKFRAGRCFSSFFFRGTWCRWDYLTSWRKKIRVICFPATLATPYPGSNSGRL